MKVYTAVIAGLLLLVKLLMAEEEASVFPEAAKLTLLRKSSIRLTESPAREIKVYDILCEAGCIDPPAGLLGYLDDLVKKGAKEAIPVIPFDYWIGIEDKNGEIKNVLAILGDHPSFKSSGVQVFPVTLVGSISLSEGVYSRLYQIDCVDTFEAIPFSKDKMNEIVKLFADVKNRTYDQGNKKRDSTKESPPAEK
jgi:hypothetical protein